MIINIGNVLNSDDLAQVRTLLSSIAFVDGRATAGWAARVVKDNEQAQASRSLDELRGILSGRLLANETFVAAVRPKRLTPLIVSRYGPGQAYGSHVDDALMNGLRTDVSFTLFLAEPDSYDGGELVIESAAGEDAVKLPAGSLVAYPSTSLHRVEPVASGVRIAAVGWARSFVREADRRDLLFDLDRARRSLFERSGKSTEFDLIAKSLSNLIRMWADD